MNKYEISYNLGDLWNRVVKQLNELAEAAPLFRINNWIVYEINNSNGFKYTMISSLSFKQKHLATYKRQADYKEYNKIRNLVIKKLIDNKLQNDIKEGTSLISFIFETLFVKHGFRIRKKQIEMSKLMFEDLMNNSINMTESAVGTGKTYAYLVAAVVAGIIKGNENDEKTIIVSTSSIELQKSIQKQYIPVLSDILMEDGLIEKSLTSIIRKGRENFICKRRLLKFEGSTNLEKAELEILKKLRHSIDFENIGNLSEKIKAEVCVKNCAGCRLINNCRYQNYMLDAKNKKYSIQICNHQYFIAAEYVKENAKKFLLPIPSAIIIDEAHNFIKAASQFYGGAVNANIVRSALAYNINANILKNSVNRFKLYDIQNVLRNNNKELDRLLEKYWSNLCENGGNIELPEDIQIELSKHFRKTVVLFEQITLIYKAEKGEDAKKIARSIKDLSLELKPFIYFERNIVFLRVDDKKKKICFTPKDVRASLRGNIWKNNCPFIFTSGTLSTNGNFNYFQQSLALCKNNGDFYQGHIFDSDFNYKKNLSIYLPENIPAYRKERKEQYIQYIIEHIFALVKATSGHTLILFSAYELLDQISDLIGINIYGIPVIKGKKSDKSALVTFKSLPNAVMLATGAFWEGIDLPGDILSSLIIVKLPFEVPDAINQYESTLYKDELEFKEKAIIPRMQIRLKQGVGRLIRTENDSGVVSILDARVGTYGKYRKVVENTLPKGKVLNSIAKVERFIKSIKSEEYFNFE